MPPRPNTSADGRDTIARWAGFATVAALAAVLLGVTGHSVLMPGPLSSAHGGVEACSACHTKSGDKKLSWLHGLVAGDRVADSKACLTCHKMPDTAMNAHGAPAEVLKESTVRLTKLAMATTGPAAGVQTALMAHHAGETGAPSCATCHQEHRGADFDIRKMTNDQCRSCHVLKFDAFDRDHPDFSAYPFHMRTRTIFDHAGHFGKHYPETAKKEPDKKIPETCSNCHDSRADQRIMAVAPFEKACASCHLDQITGKERASGPKGIAFLSLPGIDVEALTKKKALIGEWPSDSEAALTPFMRVMLARTEKGRTALVKLAGVDLQDLSQANDAQTTAVTDLVWEIKRLLNGLITGKASDILADLDLVPGTKLSAALVSDLTASLPRDVLAGAQQQWLPNLASEIANGPKPPGAPAPAPEAAPSDAPPARQEKPAEEETAQSGDANEPAVPDGKADVSTTRDPPACVVRVLGACLVAKDQTVAKEAPPPSLSEAPEGQSRLSPRGTFAPPMRAGLQDVAPAQTGAAKGAQKDELLFPTEEELRELKARNARSARSPARGPQPGDAAADARPTIDIDSGIEPENWADTGGWYRQDHAIFYRPVGHKDKFAYTWLYLTGPQAGTDTGKPVTAVFNSLAAKDAAGVCTKCHSVDDNGAKGRIVNFGPQTAQNKAGRFTRFVHEPHLTLNGDRGCLTCHGLAKDRTYLKSYERGDPKTFVSNFDPVKRDTCQSCHTQGKTRQDCQLCHSYHVNGVAQPVMQTKLPAR